MRTLRLALVGTVTLALLGGLSGAVVAQSDDDGMSETLFEITVPADLMPTELGKINLERQTLEPGVEASIGVRNESLRSRAAYVAEGELRITPMVDAWLWRGEGVIGGPPEVVPAGEPTTLATGDLVYLPAVPDEALDPEATVDLANPGTVPTTIVGFHAHQVGGGFGGWPNGMSGMALAVGSEPAALEKVHAGDTVFRLSADTVAPGTVVTPQEGAVMMLVRVESGALEKLTVGPGGEFRLKASAGSGAAIEAIQPEGLEVTWTAIGDEPTQLLALSVIPTESPEFAE